MKNLTNEQKARAVEIAMTGESPAHYLEECGVNNPHCSWWYIKKNLEKNDPETYARLPAKFKQSVRNSKAVETPEGEFAAPAVVKIDGPIRIETPETNKVEVVEAPIGGMCPPPEAKKKKLINRAVEGEFGEYHYRSALGYLDFDPKDHTGTVSMTLDEWRGFLDELHRAAEDLGVEL